MRVPLRIRAGTASLAPVLLGVALGCVPAATALAFDFSSLDFFGWFTQNNKSPEPNQKNLPYTVNYQVLGDESLKQTLTQASTLDKLRQDPPPDGEALVRRVAADLDPMLDALWGSGYYDARIEAIVAGAPVRIGDQSSAAAARLAEADRGRTTVPIQVRAEPGRLFLLRTIRIVDARTGRPFSPDEMPGKAIGLSPGDPASSAEIRAGQARMIDHLRAQSQPLARAVDLRAIVDHPAGAMDVTFVLDPGQRAGIGEISISGTKDIDPAVVRSYIYLEPGDPYSPKALLDTRKSISQIAALGSARIREADKLDANGNLPLFVDVTERPRHVIGASARYSTIDGPALHPYWEDRNLFGGAERLRFDADIFVEPRINGTTITGANQIRPSDLGARITLSFMKPALSGSRNDLLVDGAAVSERVGDDHFGGYTDRYLDGTAAIRHRFSQTLSAQAGLEVQRGQSKDVLGKLDYLLVGTPLSLRYDSTDSLLDPTTGVRVTGSIAPYAEFLGSSSGFVQTKLNGSTYYALDEDARYVLAGRIALGSIAGADLADIPANRRFYAGGGGSVRGYAYRTLAPTVPVNQLIGGRSLFEASLEARIRITDTIGIVPFVDMGGAFRSSIPDFRETIGFAAGLGLRYFTAIGPLRLDVAVPIEKRRADRAVAVYVSIGQAF